MFSIDIHIVMRSTETETSRAVASMVLEIVQSTGLITIPLPPKIPLIVTKFATLPVCEVQRFTSHVLSGWLPTMTTTMGCLAIPLASSCERVLCLIEPFLGTLVKSS